MEEAVTADAGVNIDILKAEQFNKYMGEKNIYYLQLFGQYVLFQWIIQLIFSAVLTETTGLMPENCCGYLSQNVTCFESILLEPALNMLKSEF